MEREATPDQTINGARKDKTPVSRNMTLEAWCHYWLSSVKHDVSESTHKNYRHYLTKHIVPALGQIKLKHLSAPQIQFFFDSLRQSEQIENQDSALSAKSILNMRNVLHACIKKAMDSGIISTNPVVSVDVQRVEKKDAQMLTASEVEHLLDYSVFSGNPLARSVLLVMQTGLSADDLLCLTWKQVDFDSACLRIPLTSNTAKSHAGDTGKQAGSSVMKVTGTKYLHLPDPSIWALRQIKAWQDETAEEQDECFNPDGLVFVTYDGHPVSVEAYKRFAFGVTANMGLPRAGHNVISRVFGMVEIKLQANLDTLPCLPVRKKPVAPATANAEEKSSEERMREASKLFEKLLPQNVARSFWGRREHPTEVPPTQRK